MGAVRAVERARQSPAFARRLHRGPLDRLAHPRRAERPRPREEPETARTETFPHWDLPREAELVGSDREVDGVPENRRVDRTDRARVGDQREAVPDRGPAGVQAFTPLPADADREHPRAARRRVRPGEALEEPGARVRPSR